jgi:hypothetical protein
MQREASEVERAVDELIDEYRTRCLWFLRPDYYPTTTDQRLRLLGYIERHGDLHAYRRASSFRQWLSRPSSAISAGS